MLLCSILCDARLQLHRLPGRCSDFCCSCQSPPNDSISRAAQSGAAWDPPADLCASLPGRLFTLLCAAAAERVPVSSPPTVIEPRRATLPPGRGAALMALVPALVWRLWSRRGLAPIRRPAGWICWPLAVARLVPAPLWFSVQVSRYSDHSLLTRGWRERPESTERVSRQTGACFTSQTSAHMLLSADHGFPEHMIHVLGLLHLLLSPGHLSDCRLVNTDLRPCSLGCVAIAVACRSSCCPPVAGR